jgi:hypothetical protein
MSYFDEIEYDRDYPRETLHIKAGVWIDGQWHDCVIVNISPSGAKLTLGMNVTRGMAVIVKLGELGPFRATIAWCHGVEIGVKFDHDPSEMTRVLIELELHG